MDLSNFSASKRLKGYLVLEWPDPAHVALRLCPMSVTDPFIKAPVFCWSLLCLRNLLTRLFQAFAVNQGRTDAWAETCCFIWWFCKWVARGDGGSHSEWQPLFRSPGWAWGSLTKIPLSSSSLGTFFPGSLEESLVKFLYTLFKKMNNENSSGTIQIMISKLAKAFCVCLVAQSCLTLHPTDCSPPAPLAMGFSRPECWSGLAMPSSRGYLQPRDPTQGSHIAGRFFTSWATREGILELSRTFSNSPKIWVHLRKTNRRILSHISGPFSNQ